jgi:hypothetical protein
MSAPEQKIGRLSRSLASWRPYLQQAMAMRALSRSRRHAKGGAWRLFMMSFQAQRPPGLGAGRGAIKPSTGRPAGRGDCAYPGSPIFFGNGITSAVVGAYRLMLLIWFTVSTSG